MEKILRSKIFLSVFVISFVIIFITEINVNRTYVSDMDILILPKSTVTAQDSERIIANAIVMPRLVSFYDTVLSAGGLNDPAAGISMEKRQAYWNSKIRTERIADSGIIRLSVADQSMGRAEEINQQAALSLIAELGLYYNIKTDLDIRILDGPVAKNTASESFWVMILVSVLLSALVAIIAHFFPSPDKTETRKVPSPFALANLPRMDYSQSEKDAAAENFKNEIGKEQEKVDDRIRFKPVKKTISQPPALEQSFEFPPVKKSAAPSNLPVGDENEASQTEENYSVNDSIKTQPVQTIDKSTFPKMSITSPQDDQTNDYGKDADIIREATPEEVKERLNKLLSGKF